MTTTYATETAQDIIVDSIHMTGEYAVEGEKIPGWVQDRALRLLNGLLKNRTVNNIEIPLYTEIDFTMTPGQAEYEFSKLSTADVESKRLIDVAFCNVILFDSVDPVKVVPHNRLLKSHLSRNSFARPRNVVNKRGYQKSTLLFHPAPDEAYACELYVKIPLTVVESQKALDTLPEYWIDYLKYALCRRQLPFFPEAIWTPEMEADYKELKNDILNAADLDLSPEIDETMLHRGGDWFGETLGVIT
jgi:hypothetical protein